MAPEITLAIIAAASAGLGWVTGLGRRRFTAS
jgi:hypothetical protein